MANPIIAKVVAAAFVIPAALIGIISRIQIPQSFPSLGFLRNIHLPSFMSRRHGSDYLALSQNEYNDILLNGYDGSEEQLMDEIDDADDADEL